MKLDLQKGSLAKRLAAWLLDSMLLVVLIVGAASGLTSVLDYDTYQTQLSNAYEKYQTQYGIQFQITQEDYDALPEEQRKAYDDAYHALNADEEAMYAYNMIINLTILIVSGAILIGIFISEFVVPMILKNGQTVGKKAFGLGVIRPDGVRVTGVQMFIRSILGKYAVETMISVYMFLMLLFGSGGVFSLGLMVAVPLIQVCFLLFNRNKTVIHDLLSGTVVVDLPSQMVFNSTEDLIAYKTKLHAEEANKKEY